MTSNVTQSGPSAVLTQQHPFINERNGKGFKLLADGLTSLENEAGKKLCTPFSTLPYEMLVRVFEYLTPTDMAQASQVCQDFYTAANEGGLWKRFVTFYDEPFWNKCIDTTGLDFTGDLITWNEFKRSVGILSKVKTEGTPEEGSNDIVVLTLPKGLTIAILEQRAKTTTKGNQIGFRNNPLSDTENNACVVAAQVVFMKKFIIHESRNKTRTEHESLAKDLRCVIPDVKAVAALAFLTYIGSLAESPTRLLGDEPWTYSRCEGNLFFGGFAPGGPDVNDFYYVFGYDDNGLVPLRKF